MKPLAQIVPSAAVTPLPQMNGWFACYLGVLLSGACYSVFYSTIIPSYFMLMFSYAIALATGLIYAVYAAINKPFIRDQKVPIAWWKIKTHPVIPAYVQVPLMTIMLILVSQVVYTGCAAAILNAIFGSEGAMRLTVSGWQDEYCTRNSCRCARVEVKEIPNYWIPGHAMCFRNMEKSGYPVGSRILLHGRVSLFGINPTSLTVSGSRDQ